MGKELPMARKKRARRQVLLVRASNGEFVPASSGGEKRKEEASTSKGEAHPSPISAAQASKSSSEAKVPDDAAHKAKGHRRSHKARRSDGRDEGRNKTVRRSSSELGIEWPEDRCWESPTHAHWFTAGSKIEKGTIWICKYCLRAKWMPDNYPSAETFAVSVRSLGIDEAYRRWLNRIPAVALLLRKLEDLRLMKKVVSADEYMEVVAAIMSDKEYPYNNIVEEKK